MDPSEIIIELKCIFDTYGVIGNRCAVRDCQSAYTDSFAKAILQLVESEVSEERNLGFSAGRDVEWNGIFFPNHLLSHLLTLDDDWVRGAISDYIWHHKLTDCIPRLNGILATANRKGFGGAGILGVLLDFADKRSATVFEQVYDEEIADCPVRREQYQQVQAKWAGDRLRQNIHPLPKQTRGVYLPKGSIGTAFPIDDLKGPVCTCCGVAMMCLLRLPKEADPLEMPVFHCPRCLFHDMLYLDLNSAPPTWIGTMDAETYYPDESYNIAGSIAWGTEIIGASRSTTFIGGKPDWAQGEFFFDCPKCKKKMEFVIQLDSEFTGITELNFYHHGIMYVHRCRGCNVQAYGFQTS